MVQVINKDYNAKTTQTVLKKHERKRFHFCLERNILQCLPCKEL